MEKYLLVENIGLFWGIPITFHAAQGFSTIPIKIFQSLLLVFLYFPSQVNKNAEGFSGIKYQHRKSCIYSTSNHIFLSRVWHSNRIPMKAAAQLGLLRYTAR